MTYESTTERTILLQIVTKYTRYKADVALEHTLKVK